jgi:hypothetical protein
MKNWQEEAVGRIWKKFNTVENVMCKWDVSTAMLTLGPDIDALAQAKKKPEQLEAYYRENEQIAQKYGTKTGEVVTPYGDVLPRYSFTDVDSYNAELKVLNEKYEEVLKLEPDRIEGIQVLLNTEVEVDIKAIDYEHVSKLIDAGELAFLRGLGLINPPKDIKPEESNVTNITDRK